MLAYVIERKSGQSSLRKDRKARAALGNQRLQSFWYYDQVDKASIILHLGKEANSGEKGGTG